MSLWFKVHIVHAKLEVEAIVIMSLPFYLKLLIYPALVLTTFQASRPAQAVRSLSQYQERLL